MRENVGQKETGLYILTVSEVTAFLSFFSGFQIGGSFFFIFVDTTHQMCSLFLVVISLVLEVLLVLEFHGDQPWLVVGVRPQIVDVVECHVAVSVSTGYVVMNSFTDFSGLSTVFSANATEN